MSAPDAVVLVDGSNVLHCARWGGRDRGELVRLVEQWAAAEGVQVLLAIDGSGQGVSSRLVEVVPSGAGEADDVLARRAAELRGQAREHWVVSSDGAVRASAGSAAARTLAAGDFVGMLDAAPLTAAPSSDPPDSTSRIADAVDEDLRSRLERMRRGHHPHDA
jgi:predicted RNA-binding protein with PIN domain